MNYWLIYIDFFYKTSELLSMSESRYNCKTSEISHLQVIFLLEIRMQSTGQTIWLSQLRTRTTLMFY